MAMLAVCCVYPFSAEVEDGSGGLVVEGEVKLGEYTTVILRYSNPLSTPRTDFMVSDGEVWLEDSDGHTYEATQDPDSPGNYVMDTRNASVGPDYRLHIRNGETGHDYVSSWEQSNAAPVIDSLSYILDYDRERMNIAISMHSGGNSYFKWRYMEDWEYRAEYYASLMYIPPEVDRWGRPKSTGSVESNTEDMYTCWSHRNSSEILIFSTEKQSEDRFVDLEFITIPRNDFRISQIYRVEVTLMPLTKEAYLYWDNIRTNSEYVGDLFSPTPSEMVGNIRCEQDPDEQVIGYFSVSEVTRKTLYVYYTEDRFYYDRTPDREPVIVNPADWYDYYMDGYLPWEYYMPGQVQWLPKRCVDCRYLGGKNVPPDYWLKDVE